MGSEKEVMLRWVSVTIYYIYYIENRLLAVNRTQTNPHVVPRPFRARVLRTPGGPLGF